MVSICLYAKIFNDPSIARVNSINMLGKEGGMILVFCENEFDRENDLIRNEDVSVSKGWREGSKNIEKKVG